MAYEVIELGNPYLKNPYLRNRKRLGQDGDAADAPTQVPVPGDKRQIEAGVAGVLFSGILVVNAVTTKSPTAWLAAATFGSLATASVLKALRII